jgi:hypothetical protein
VTDRELAEAIEALATRGRTLAEFLNGQTYE